MIRDLLLAKTLALLALAFSMVYIAVTLPGAIDRALAREGAETRRSLERVALAVAATGDSRLLELQKAARSEIRATRASLVSEVQQTRTDATERLDRAGPAILGEVHGIREDVNAHLLGLNGSIAQLAAVGPPMTRAAGRIAEVVEISTDCESSPRCWQNVIYDLDKAAQQSSKSFVSMQLELEKHLPSITASVDQTGKALTSMAQDGAKVTARLTAPKTWRQKAWETVKLGAILAGRVF